MKILVTGCTATQVGRGDPLGCSPLVKAVVGGLEALGHRVDHRIVETGEDLRAYHRALVFLAPPLTFGCRYLYGALWALATARRAAASFDDWQLEVFLAQFRSVTGPHAHRLWDVLAATNRPADDRARALKRGLKGRLEGVATVVAANAGWPWRVGMPMFPWGDPARSPVTGGRLTPYDPSPLVVGHLPAPTIVPWARRRKEWLLVTIADHRPWLAKQALTWPVRYVGGTLRMRLPERYPEAKVIAEVYPHHVGALVPTYKHAGLAWWRPRFLHAARTGVILAGDGRDLGSVSYSYATPGEIERLSDFWLRSYARDQGARIAVATTGSANRDRTLEALRKLIS